MTVTGMVIIVRCCYLPFEPSMSNDYNEENFSCFISIWFLHFHKSAG